jgi:hypothetical protein
MKLTRTLALTILNTIPEDCTQQHPFAQTGTLTDLKRANDKKITGNKSTQKAVGHYYSKGFLFFVADASNKPSPPKKNAKPTR